MGNEMWLGTHRGERNRAARGLLVCEGVFDGDARNALARAEVFRQERGGSPFRRSNHNQRVPEADLVGLLDL